MGRVVYGVAQGSILGPLLSSIYMNSSVHDLPFHFTCMNLQMYVDDTILFCEFDTRDDPSGKVIKINEELEIQNGWCKSTLVTVNIDKTKFMSFAPSKRKYDDDFGTGVPILRLNEQNLGHVCQYKYLGME